MPWIGNVGYLEQDGHVHALAIMQYSPDRHLGIPPCLAIGFYQRPASGNSQCILLAYRYNGSTIYPPDLHMKRARAEHIACFS